MFTRHLSPYYCCPGIEISKLKRMKRNKASPCIVPSKATELMIIIVVSIIFRGNLIAHPLWHCKLKIWVTIGDGLGQVADHEFLVVCRKGIF